jgi:hypothetical protein
VIPPLRGRMTSASRESTSARAMGVTGCFRRLATSLRASTTDTKDTEIAPIPGGGTRAGVEEVQKTPANGGEGGIRTLEAPNEA